MSFGAKADNLLLLRRARFPVPETRMFELKWVWAHLSRSIPQLEAWLGEVARWQPGEPEPETLARVRQAILAVREPEEWQELEASFSRELGASIIVRSSMSAEDMGISSFAGCFHSERSSPDGAWESARRVLASAYSSQALRQILSAGVSPLEFQPGFFVQKFVEGSAAGVCFSRDPSDVWERRAVAEWAGSSETVVQGNSAVTQIACEGRTTSDAMFLPGLWMFAAEAEEAIGWPADLEWVWDDSQLWILQVRPIATAEARLAARTRPQGRWTRELTMERFPEALTPMGWSILNDAFETNLRVLSRDFGVIARRPDDVAVSVGGVIYSDPEFFKFPGGVRIRWSHYLAPWKASFWRLVKAGARALSTLVGRNREVRLAAVSLEVVDGLLAKQARLLTDGWEAHRDANLKHLNEFKARPSLDVLAAMEELKAISSEFMEPDLAIFLIKDTTYKALLKLWTALGFESARFPELVLAMGGNRTLEMNADWRKLVSALRADSARGEFLACGDANVLAEPARQRWSEFLSRNGHSTTSWDVAVPSWGEAPRQLLPLLRAAMLETGRGLRTDATARREKTLRELADTLRGRGLGWALEVVERSLARLEAFMRMDEEQHFLSGLLLEPSRRLILAAAPLVGVSDPFFLTLAELKSELRSPSGRPLSWLCERRRADWERAKRQPAALELPRRALAPTTVALDGFAGVRGVGVSPGIALGKLHFAEHLSDADGLPTGAILVTTSPNPSLTPVYPLLSGMISATGGPLSHGFVAAREYGLPAVSGVADLAEKLKPGMMVRLDGAAGTIEVIA